MSSGNLYISISKLYLIQSAVSRGGCIQGTLEVQKSGDGELSQIVSTKEPSFEPLLKSLALKRSNPTLCTDELEILDPDDLNKKGQVLKGEFTVQGEVLPWRESLVSTLRVLKGKIPPSLAQPQDVYLALIPKKSLYACPAQTESAIVFGTQTSRMPIVPVLEYCKPVFENRLAAVIIACANGIFHLTRMPPSSRRMLAVDRATESEGGVEKAIGGENGEQLGASEKVIQNVINDIRYVCEVDTEKDDVKTESKVVYRIARDAVLIASSDQQSVVDEIQRKALKDFGVFGEESGNAKLNEFQFSNTSITLTTGVVCKNCDKYPSWKKDNIEKLVRDHLPNMTVREESLVDWQRPYKRLNLSITLAAPEQSASDKDEATETYRDGRIRLKLDLSYVPLRKPRAGEAAGDPQSRLKRIFLEDIEKLAHYFDMVRRKDDLSAILQKLAEKAQKRLKDSDLFPEAVEVKVACVLSTENGALIQMDDGKYAVVPKYGLSQVSQRLAIYFSVMWLAGVSVTFVSWNLARKNGLNVTLPL